jgi:hypothetical protein
VYRHRGGRRSRSRGPEEKQEEEDIEAEDQRKQRVRRCTGLEE